MSTIISTRPLNQVAYVPPLATETQQALWETIKASLLAFIGARNVRYDMFKNLQLHAFRHGSLTLSVSQPHLKQWAEADEQMAVIQRFCDQYRMGVTQIEIILRSATRRAPVYDPEADLRNNRPASPPPRPAPKSVLSRVTLPPKPGALADSQQDESTLPQPEETYMQRNARLARKAVQRRTSKSHLDNPILQSPSLKRRSPRKIKPDEQAASEPLEATAAALPDLSNDEAKPSGKKAARPRKKPQTDLATAVDEFVEPSRKSPLGILMESAAITLKIDQDDLRTKAVTEATVQLKRIVAYLAHRLLGVTFADLGPMLGGIGAPQVQALLEELERQRSEDLKLDADIDQIQYLYTSYMTTFGSSSSSASVT